MIEGYNLDVVAGERCEEALEVDVLDFGDVLSNCRREGVLFPLNVGCNVDVEKGGDGNRKEQTFNAV